LALPNERALWLANEAEQSEGNLAEANLSTALPASAPQVPRRGSHSFKDSEDIQQAVCEDSAGVFF